MADKAGKFEIFENSLVCVVCKHDEFYVQQITVNTNLLSGDFLEPTAKCFICDRCGFIHWFLPKNQ